MSKAVLEKRIEECENRNRSLKKELEETRVLYKQLITEADSENFDERRVTLLKSQVMQLERQVVLLTESLSCRSHVIIEVEGVLLNVADFARGYIGQEISGPEVRVPRSDLTRLVELAEQTRSRLSKNIECDRDKLYHPLLVPEKYVHPSKQGALNVLDVFSGNLEHLNLKHVAKLESRLCKLYKKLVSLQWSLQTSANQQPDNDSFYSNNTLCDRTRALIGQSVISVRECSQDLQDLSILVPSAPWPVLNKRPLEGVTTDDVVRRLPGMARSRHKEARHVIDSLLKAISYQSYLDKLQLQAVTEELNYHRSVYETQLKYTEALFEALKGGYQEFKRELCIAVSQPLSDILKTYDTLCGGSTPDDDLRQFLTTFKANSTQLEEIKASLQQDDTGQEALNQFEGNFQMSVQELEKICQRNVLKIRQNIERSTAEMEDVLGDTRDMLSPSKAAPYHTAIPKSDSLSALDTALREPEGATVGDLRVSNSPPAMEISSPIDGSANHSVEAPRGGPQTPKYGTPSQMERIRSLESVKGASTPSRGGKQVTPTVGTKTPTTSRLPPSGSTTGRNTLCGSTPSSGSIPRTPSSGSMIPTRRMGRTDSPVVTPMNRLRLSKKQ